MPGRHVFCKQRARLRKVPPTARPLPSLVTRVARLLNACVPFKVSAIRRNAVQSRVRKYERRLQKRSRPSPLALGDLSDGVHDDATLFASSGGGTRTPDTRIMIPLDAFAKSVHGADFEDTSSAVCTYVCTSILADRDLARIVARWPSLSQKKRSATKVACGSGQLGRYRESVSDEPGPFTF